MHISLSATDAVLWYKYKGKRATYSDHNPEYDLELVPNDIIGIKGNILVHQEEQSIKFRMSSIEISKILKSSTKLDYDHKIYPPLALPCTAKDVKKLYDLFNKKYFAGELPDDTVFVKARSARTFGKAYYKGHGKPMKLQFGEAAMTSVPLFCDMVIHEMIHLLHYKRCYRDGRAEYAEQGHGALFKQDMQRLNKFGFNIRIRGSDYESAELQDAVHVVLFKGEDRLGFWSRTPIEPTDLLIVLQRHYNIQPTSYVVGTVLDNRALNLNQLNLKNQIVLGRKVRTSNTWDVESTMTVTERKEVVAPDNVSSAVIGAVASAARALDFVYVDYLYNVLHYLFKTVKDPRDFEKLVPAVADRAYIKKVYDDISDKDIVTGTIFKAIKRELLVQRLDGDKALDYIVLAYNQTFKSRVAPARFAELAAAYFDIITMPHSQIVKGLVKRLG